MPWLSILMFLVTFFLSGGDEKKNRNKALVNAGLVAAGTYYTTHETDWGQRTLGEFDGVVQTPTDSSPVVDADGKPVSVAGSQVTVPVKPSGESSTTGFWKTLQAWGATGTAAVVGTGAAVATGNTKWLLWAAAAIAAVMILK